METQEKGGEPPHHRRTYILTLDLGPKIGLLQQAGIKTPAADDPLFRDIQAELIRRIESFFPRDEVRAISTADLAQDILDKAKEKVEGLNNAMMISTCNDIAMCGNGIEIHINRVVDMYGKLIGLGPRPNHGSLMDQMNDVRCIYSRKDLVLVEDGTFTGGTICQILKLIPNSIKTIVVGIGFPDAVKNIRKVFDGEIIVIENIDDPLDWMPDHDFFACTPNSGRIVGTLGLGLASCNPLTMFEPGPLQEMFFSMPYILPFAPEMSEWTSIPSQHTVDFSRFCLSASIEIYTALESMNGRPIHLSTLKQVRPSVSIPIMYGVTTHDASVRKDLRVVQLLENYRDKLL